MKDILTTNHLLTAYKEAAAIWINASIGIAFTFYLEEETLQIKIEGRTSVTNGTAVLPSSNGALILIGSDVMDILHGVAVDKSVSAAAIKDLTVAWKEAKFIEIERVSYVMGNDEEELGSTTVITHGLIENFRLGFGSVQESYHLVGLNTSSDENEIPDYVLVDTKLYIQQQEEGKQDDAT